jgi:hypothetical protein
MGDRFAPGMLGDFPVAISCGFDRDSHCSDKSKRFSGWRTGLPQTIYQHTEISVLLPPKDLLLQ